MDVMASMTITYLVGAVCSAIILDSRKHDDEFSSPITKSP